jgi:uncharacterized membrane protein YhhN
VPFAPFIIVALIHLATLLLGNDEWSSVTKPWLMPALLVSLAWYMLGVLRLRVSTVLLLAAVGIAFSWLGDVLLSSPEGIGFLLGLGSFALAHIAYLVLFLVLLRERRVPLASIGFVVWWGAMVAVLAPHVGDLLVPVAIYGLLIVGVAAVSFCANRFVVVGALTFLISDTLLSLKFFVPGWEFYPIDFIIMAFYLVGQGFIAYGAAHRARVLAS